MEKTTRRACSNTAASESTNEVALSWATHYFDRHNLKLPEATELTSHPVRDVACINAEGKASLLSLSSTWNLRRIPVLSKGPLPDLDTFLVGLLDLSAPASTRVRHLIEAYPRIKWIALLPQEKLVCEEVRTLIRESCYDFHTLPLDQMRLDITLGRAHGMAELEAHSENTNPDWQVCEDIPIIGESEPMLKLFARLMRVASSQVPVLIQGESGTGKELAALAVHRNSSRKDGPFVAVNCGALPSQLIQSELFGHEAGAFTGAVKRKLGQLELAHGGTLLLDEVGDLNLDLQVNLLRFLQEGTFWRLGGVQPIRIDVRVVAATHVDLAEAVAEGRFREDLYYRLNVIQLDVPPLRERGSADMTRLARFYLERFRSRNPRLKGYSQGAIEVMCSHHWPGNVRELINRVQRGIAMAEDRLIRPEDMGFDPDDEGDDGLTLEEARNQAERESVNAALEKSAYNVSQAARRLGIGRVTLYRLIHKHEISLPERS